MSAGRGSFALSDLSSLMASGAFTCGTVAPDTSAPATPAPDTGEWDLAGAPGWVQPTPQPIDRRLDHDGDWAWRKPVDWPYRTEPEDVLADAVDLAIERLPMHLAVLVETVVYMRGGAQALKAVKHQERKVIEAKVAKCRLEVLRDLAKLPGKTPKRKKPKWRTEGPSSDVVTYRPDGTVLVNGYKVECLIEEDLMVRDEPLNGVCR